MTHLGPLKLPHFGLDTRVSCKKFFEWRWQGWEKRRLDVCAQMVRVRWPHVLARQKKRQRTKTNGWAFYCGRNNVRRRKKSLHKSSNVTFCRFFPGKCLLLTWPNQSWFGRATTQSFFGLKRSPSWRSAIKLSKGPFRLYTWLNHVMSDTWQFDLL